LRGLGSTPFDDEGVAVNSNIIDDGVLTTWLLNSAAAKQLGLRLYRSRLARPGGAAGRLDPQPAS
jgi:PmbA protein